MIFLIAYGGGHVAMLAPIAEELRAQGRPFTFLALTTARSYLDARAIESIGFKDLPGADDKDVLAFGASLAASVEPNGQVSREETIAYLGLNYRDLVELHGQHAAAEIYALEGRKAFFPVLTLERALRRIKPELLIATNSPRSERAAITAASKLGIPAICLVDMFALQEAKWIGQPAYADRICVLNERVRDMFLGCGRQAEEVIVTGNPAFDQLNAVAVRQAGAAMRRDRHWDDGSIVILWASQREPAVHPFDGRAGDPLLPRHIEQQLRGFIALNPAYRLVIRYHPSESIEFEPQDRVRLSPHVESLAALLHAVDVVVVTASTVGLEAYLVGRTVISVDCSVFTVDAPFADMGISYGVKRAEDLSAALLALQPRQVNQPAAAGTAKQSVMRVIDSLVN